MKNSRRMLAACSPRHVTAAHGPRGRMRKGVTCPKSVCPMIRNHLGREGQQRWLLSLSSTTTHSERVARISIYISNTEKKAKLVSTSTSLRSSAAHGWCSPGGHSEGHPGVAQVSRLRSSAPWKLIPAALAASCERRWSRAARGAQHPLPRPEAAQRWAERSRPRESVLCWWSWGRGSGEQLPPAHAPLLPPSPGTRHGNAASAPSVPPAAAQRAPYSPRATVPRQRGAGCWPQTLVPPKENATDVWTRALPGTARAALPGTRARLGDSSVPKGPVQAGFSRELAWPSQRDGHLGLQCRAATPALSLTCPQISHKWFNLPLLVLLPLKLVPLGTRGSGSRTLGRTRRHSPLWPLPAADRHKEWAEFPRVQVLCKARQNRGVSVPGEHRCSFPTLGLASNWAKGESPAWARSSHIHTALCQGYCELAAWLISPGIASN